MPRIARHCSALQSKAQQGSAAQSSALHCTASQCRAAQCSASQSNAWRHLYCGTSLSQKTLVKPFRRASRFLFPATREVKSLAERRKGALLKTERQAVATRHERTRAGAFGGDTRAHRRVGQPADRLCNPHKFLGVSQAFHAPCNCCQCSSNCATVSRSRAKTQ